MNRPRSLALALALILLATGLRFHRLDAQSFWNDEGNSARLAGRSARLIVEGAAGDIHPPGYYLALKAWRTAFGESEFALRSLSAFAGVLLVALVYRLGRFYFDAPAALGAALLAAGNPFLVYYSQEARMYVPVTMLGAASFLSFSSWLKSSRPPRREIGDWRLGAGYILATAAGLYTHYAFPFVLAAENLAAVGGLAFHRGRNNARRFGVWIGMQALTLVLFLPWLPVAVRQLTTWPSARESRPFVDALIELGRLMLFGRTIETSVVLPGLIAGGLLLLLGLHRGGQTITPLLWLGVPVGLILGLGLFSEAFAKFALVAVPPLVLILGNGLGAVFSTTTRRDGEENQTPNFKLQTLRASASRWAGLVAMLFVGLGTVRSLVHLYTDPRYFRDDYRGIARMVEAGARAGDAVILISPNQWEVFTYYHREGTPAFPLPRTRPLVEAETRAELEAIAARHSRLFVLYWGDAQADPNHFVEGWLNANTFKATDEWRGQVRLATYAVPQAVAAEPEVKTDARFGNAIALDGFTLQSASLRPGDILQLTLYWRALGRPDADHTVFVHLSPDPATPPLAQQDGEPGGGLDPTGGWQPGEAHADNHGVFLPPDLPPGEYQLLVGLYDPLDGGRLPAFRQNGPVGDSLVLQAITVGATP